MNCPNCSSAMERHALSGVHGRDIEVDLCFGCHVLWLDQRESIHLAPRGTLELFRVLQAHEGDPRHPLGRRVGCPRCERRLTLHHDIGKGGRFAYYACPAHHGRLTPFSEFLKEKQFVRALSPLEEQRLRAELKQVQCSGCGAPIDLMKGFQCGHCGASITVLDADAVAKTLRELEEADARRSVDPDAREARARALAAMEALRSGPDDTIGTISSRAGRLGGASGLDLLTESIRRVFGAW